MPYKRSKVFFQDSTLGEQSFKRADQSHHKGSSLSKQSIFTNIEEFLTGATKQDNST